MATAIQAQSAKKLLADAQQLFQGIEATAKILSTQVNVGDLDTDLVAVCMTIAREAEWGVLTLGEALEAV